MTTLQGVKDICDRLAPLGWRDLLLRVTGNQLDIRQATPEALKAALLGNLPSIDRTFPGFADFATDGNQGITPGVPGRSLLYHAIASPGLLTGTAGPLHGFATLREIEVVENFVFGVQPPTLAQLRQAAGIAASAKFSVVVFAYEYRPAAGTCSALRADLAFSRTGISRVGTREAQYTEDRRGFQSEAEDDPFAFRVCPARFGAFLSVRRKASAPDFAPMRPQPGDSHRSFWVPVHKLFDGTECIKGLDLTVTFDAFHYNDKIRRIQVFLGKNPPAISPFQFSDGIAEFLDPITTVKGLLCPVVHPRLVEPAISAGNFLTFRVPPSDSTFAALEPDTETDAQTNAEVRPASAYVHARTEVRRGKLIDLNSDPQRPDVLKTVRKGNYDALHYLDFTGEGAIGVQIPALAKRAEVESKTVQAYSLVAAPDFFPSAGQRELSEWTVSPQVPIKLRETIWGIPPVPLCDTRLPANLQMPNNSFDPDEITITAMVPLLGSTPQGSSRPPSLDPQRHSCLPDDAAGVFAPGWDVSTDKVKRDGRRILHLAAYGLGSPFPEDSKLCAALSTFWSSVAPDITRGMSIPPGNPELRHTVAPLTDDEIGQTGSLPWDGNPGPKVVTLQGQQFAELASFLHTDYVQSALEKRFTSRLTARVTSEEYERRVLAMAFTYAVLGGNHDRWFLLSFRVLQAGDAELQQAQVETSTVLTQPVYRFDVFQADETTEKPSPSNFRKRLLPIFDRRFFLVDTKNRIVLQRREEQTIWSLATLPL